MAKLETTDTILHALYALLEDARGKTIKVNAEHLSAILHDHVAMFDRLTTSGKLVIELAADQASLVGNLSKADFAELEKSVAQRQSIRDRSTISIPATVDNRSPVPRPAARGGSKVWADGKEHPSILAAFAALKLPISKHQKFRAQLKIARALDFVHGERNIKFEYR